MGDIKNPGEEKINFFKFKNISIDSRTLLKNDLFIAIKGKNFDAHNFLPEVLKKEVKAVVIKEGMQKLLPSDFPYWVVNDTLEAFQKLTLLKRKKLNIPLVAITGSVGKTTTKEMIGEVLKKLGKVKLSHANFNNEIGVGLSILETDVEDKVIELKQAVDAAIESGADKVVEKVVVVQRTKKNISMVDDRDLWWHELLKDQKDQCEPEIMNSEDRLFILYTSGSTGKPKGVVHTTGGYNLWSHLTFKWIFDLKDDDIYWCTADVGWITGHSYIVYGPLSNGATTLMYEGVPRPSNLGAFWEIVQKYKVSIFYTAPTAIRAFMKSGREIPDKYNLDSLRLLGTVGEPINPEAWIWYKDVIGKNKCPIVDTWWQTETGGVMISPLPGIVATKPGSATFPLPGIEVEIVDKNGDKVKENEGGYLIIKKPWPGMMRTIHGNSERYLESYWEYISFKGEKNVYFAGDGARIDEDGYIWIMGRVDDVISVSGHRLGTMEIESALVSHKSVAESAVVGKKDDLKGEVIVAFVSLEKDVNGSSELVEDLKKHVVNEIGIIAKPEKIIISDSLPKTRSGKIMRRILRSLAAGEKISGDISTLEDSSVLEKLKELS